MLFRSVSQSRYKKVGDALLAAVQAENAVSARGEMVKQGGFAAAVPAVFSYFGQKSANETNMALGREQMDFQERMSSTSYQRGVKDMQAAGLNPMLAYSQGGASSPIGSMPQVQNAVGAAVSSAHQGSQTVQNLQAVEMNKAQIEQVNAQTEKIKSETLEQSLNTARQMAEIKRLQTGADYVAGPQSSLTRAQASKEVTLGEKAVGDALLAAVQAENAVSARGEMVKQGGFAADVARRKAESALAQLEIPKSKAEASFYEGLGQANPYLAQLLMILKGVSSARSSFR